MRKLKRALAVFISITFVLGLAVVPAFAAQSLKYEDEAFVLYQLDLFRGVSTTEYKPNLEQKLLREEAVALLLRMFNLEDEALRMDEREAKELLNNKFKDYEQIASWAVKYIAYAVVNNVIAGRPDGNFAPKDNLLGREYAKMILAMLGYVQNVDFIYQYSMVEFCNVTGFPKAEAPYLDEQPILRDHVVGMSYNALKAEYAAGANKGRSVIEVIAGNDESKKTIAIREGLLEKPVIVSVETLPDIEIKVGQAINLPYTVKATYSDGKTSYVPVKWPYIDTSKAMPKTQIKGTIDGTNIFAGVNITIEQVALQVRKVTAGNLIEVVIEFNKDVSENPEVIKKENYSLDAAKIKSVDAEGNTAVLTLEKAPDNQKKAKLTINEKILPAKGTFEFSFFDAQLPEILDIEVTGPKELTAVFSEPIGDVKDAQVILKHGYSTLSVNRSGIEAIKEKVRIPLYSSLVDGREYTVSIQGFKDYAGYSNIIRTITINYEKDETPPEVEIEAAKQEYIIVRFSKPVLGLHKEQFSHTFSAWTALKITSDEDGTVLIDPAKSYERVYVWFYTGDKKNDKPIPEGYATIRILGKVVPSGQNKTYEIVDLWDNKFETEIFNVYVAADTSAPGVKEIRVIAEDALEIEFTKIVTFNKDNIEILDEKGKAISGLTVDIQPKSDSSVFTVSFNNKLAGRTIIVNIDNVYDASINSNKLSYYSEAIEITDKTPPEITKVTYGVEKEGSKEVAWFLYVFFNEAIDPGTTLNPGNYYLVNGSSYTKLTEAAEMYAGEKIVKILLTSGQKSLVNINSTRLFATNVKDLAGNEISPALETITDMKDSSNAPFILSAIAVDPDLIEVTFSEELATYDMDAFVVDLLGSPTDIDIIGLNAEIDNKGRTKLIMTINGRLPANTTGDKIKIVEPKAITNQFGVEPAILQKEITDCIKPEVIRKNPIVVDSNGKIVIRFTEPLFESYDALIPIDLVIEEKYGNNTLKPAVDYTATVDNTYERVWIDGEYIDVYGKMIVSIKFVLPGEVYRIYSKSEPEFIWDAKGNTAKPFTNVVEIKGNDLIGGAIDTLNAAKAEANGKVEADYTPQSWTEFTAARAAALALPESNKTQIAAKINAINEAIGKLVFAGQAALDAARDEANGKVQSAYTAESWAAFAAARTVALAMPESTNQEVVAKTNAINNAITLLVTHEQALEQALTAAVDGGTISLTGNVTADIVANKLISLDLKGFTITGNVSITSNTAGTITIKDGTIDGNLTVNAPNATVNNSAIVTGIVTITDISPGTWNESANGNIIVIKDDTGITINIAPGCKIESLSLDMDTGDDGDSPVITLVLGEGAEITNPITISKPVTLICSKPVQADIAKDVKVIVKESANSEPKEIVGTGDNEIITVKAYHSVEVGTREELLNALNNNEVDIILLKNDIAGDKALTSPLIISRKVTIEGIDSEGGRRVLAINSGTGKTGDNTTEGLGICADGVTIRNITITGNHGDNLVEIFNNADDAELNMVINLENVAAIDGKKAGIYADKDNAGTITVNFKSITTSGNGVGAGIGLAAQKEGSKVAANFSGTHSFGEPAALYNEGTRYPGTYEVNDDTGTNSLAGYAEVTVSIQQGEQPGTQQKWVRVSLANTKTGEGEIKENEVKLESSYGIEGLKTYLSLYKTVIEDGEEKDEPIAFKDIFQSFKLTTTIDGNDDGPYDMIQLIDDEASSFIYGLAEGYILEADKPQVINLDYSIAAGAPAGSYKLMIQVKQKVGEKEKPVAEFVKTFEIPVL